MTNCSDTILEVLFKGCYRFTMTVADNENFILISENCFLGRKIWKIPAGWMALLVANWNNFVRACLYTDNLICFLYYKRMFFVLFLCFCKLNHFVNEGFFHLISAGQKIPPWHKQECWCGRKIPRNQWGVWGILTLQWLNYLLCTWSCSCPVGHNATD